MSDRNELPGESFNEPTPRTAGRAASGVKRRGTSRRQRERDRLIEAQIDQFAAQYPFALDQFQREAIRFFLEGDSVMVAAPTGSGKTVVAEFGVYNAFRGTGRVFYTTPIKALSNQKFRDLRGIYGNDVGLLTGDVTENREARVIVMTTEILRNMLLQAPWELDDVDCVIFDEIHYLADPERGTTWEEAIILCPEHIQLICLSATVSNAGEIADWISRTHRPIKLVTHNERPVPLVLEYFVDGQLQTVINERGELVKDFKRLGGEARRYGGRGFRQRRPEPSGPELDEPQPREIVDALEAKGLLPAIYFLFSRNDCQLNAERLAMMRASLATPAQEERIQAIIDAHLGQLRPEDFELEQVKSIISLARRGIGFHHAGLLPILKQLVEVLFNQGLMQVVFATDTLALGVNMPARTVVIGRMSKWDGRRRRMLIPNEFQQMAGRAGRRGMDRLGYVVVPYSPWFTFREMLEIATGELLPVRSAFSIRYNTVLNLWDPPEGERVRQVLQQSLAQFQTSQRIRQIENDIVEVGGDIAMVPQGCLIGYEDGDNLLEDYRALINTLTTLHGRLRRTQDELDQLFQQALSGTPWPEPGRQALRKVFRTAAPGVVVHSRTHGWGVFLGRGGRGGVGRFLFGDRIVLVVEYREIDYLFDEDSVTLPLGLVEPPDDVEDPLELVAPAELDVVRRQLAGLDLPDLEAERAEYQARERERLREQEVVLREQIAAINGEIEELEAQRDLHPCHFCERRKEHRNNLARVDRLQQERNALEELLAQEIDAEEARIRGVIRGIRDVLHRFGYLRRGYPTAKADMLAEIFDNDGLILCEMVDRGWLDRLAPEDVAEVFSWFCYDRDARFMNYYTLPPQLVLLRRRLEELEGDILGEERDHGLFISEGHNQAFYGAARAWCTGASLASISETIELSEGDLVLTINKTIDLMRQVREMLADVMPEHPLRLTLHLAEGLLRRGIVEQSLTIGFAPVLAPDDVPDDVEPEEPEAPDGNDDTERFEYELPPITSYTETPEGPVAHFATRGDDELEQAEESVARSDASPRTVRRNADRGDERIASAVQREAEGAVPPAPVETVSTPKRTSRRKQTEANRGHDAALTSATESPAPSDRPKRHSRRSAPKAATQPETGPVPPAGTTVKRPRRRKVPATDGTPASPAGEATEATPEG